MVSFNKEIPIKEPRVTEFNPHSDAHKILIAENLGKLCPKCNIKSQANKINDVPIESENSGVYEIISELSVNKVREHNFDPVWKCIKCGHEWQGSYTTELLD
jgi:hypothetical protein